MQQIILMLLIMRTHLIVIRPPTHIPPTLPHYLLTNLGKPLQIHYFTQPHLLNLLNFLLETLLNQIDHQCIIRKQKLLLWRILLTILYQTLILEEQVVLTCHQEDHILCQVMILISIRRVYIVLCKYQAV